LHVRTVFEFFLSHGKILILSHSSTVMHLLVPFFPCIKRKELGINVKKSLGAEVQEPSVLQPQPSWAFPLKYRKLKFHGGRINQD
jgi:hypothetical protein